MKFQEINIKKIDSQQENDINYGESLREIKSVYNSILKRRIAKKKEIRQSKKFIRSIIDTSDEIKGHDERISFIYLCTAKGQYIHIAAI